MKYKCAVCGYVYDEQKEGVPFAELPRTWKCPVCYATKSAFEKIEEPTEVKKEVVSEAKVKTNADVEADEEPDEEEDLKELSAGELSALFSNLARGCEKQYHEHEAQLFREIAEYFEKRVPQVKNADMKALADSILKDLDERFPAVENMAKGDSDRGMLRAYTWANKVTKMQQAIVERYKNEGEAFLEHTNVWVCSICGFIHVGDKPLDLCPVCKVPGWKFEKVEGGRA